MLFDEIPEGILSKSRQCLGALTARTKETLLQQHNTADNHYCKVVCCVLAMQLCLLWFLQMSRFTGVLLFEFRVIYAV